MRDWWNDSTARKLPKPKKAGKSVLADLRVHSIDEMEKLYTPEEAAAVLRCTVKTLSKWKCLGIIEATKQGRNVFYTAQQIADCRRKRELEWHELRKKAYAKASE